ncbi:MAG TPA: bifunctional diguanylate cyclase/phosphodiesterase [Beijerinckiaceae bacterium]|nr:bifunctional diguanylate cyclase/phosphodiesterase [Beijerinckiaceae bacterium]
MQFQPESGRDLDPKDRTGSSSAALDARSILSSVGEAVYSWDIESDRITWSQNAVDVLGIAEMAQISSGAGYAVVTDSASPTSLQSTIFECQRKDKGTGVPYTARYLINPAPGRRVWVEDKGRWFANAQGRPWLAHGVVRVVALPSETEARITDTRQVDPATGALTRPDFCNAVGEALERMRKDKRNFVLLICAIEDLAHHNKTYGYNVGDELIAAIARRIRSHIRKLDGIGRYAGNKLGVLLCPSLPDEMERTATRIAHVIRDAPIETSAGTIFAQVRIGGVAAPRDAGETSEVLAAAEEALAEAKASTTQIFAAYTKDSERVRTRRANVAASDEVLAALNDRRIILAYQPIVRARTRDVAMYEALVRMRGLSGELLGAGRIVPMAEKLGIVHLLDHRVLELAVGALRQHQDLRLTINAGVSTAMHPEWLPALRSQLAACPDVAPRLVIEITETSLIDDLAGASRMVESIKSLGARVAIDDFGAGHTSFRNMRMLPIDILKIDGAFIKNLTQSSDDRFFVRTLLQLAGHLKIETVAEWVQDEESAKLLADWGVAYLQGDHIGEPILDIPASRMPGRAVA